MCTFKWLVLYLNSWRTLGITFSIISIVYCIVYNLLHGLLFCIILYYYIIYYCIIYYYIYCLSTICNWVTTATIWGVWSPECVSFCIFCINHCIFSKCLLCFYRQQNPLRKASHPLLHIQAHRCPWLVSVASVSSYPSHTQ